METIEAASLSEVIEDLDARNIWGYDRVKAIHEYLNLKARRQDAPVSGTLELTPLCNLDCKMCYVHLHPHQMNNQDHLLTTQEWIDIIQQAIDAGMAYASLTGGECLTYPGFRDVYLYLVSHGVQPNILTNGCLLTEEMVDFFAKYPPGIIQITLYGSNDDAYERVCGRRAFSDVISGIHRAKKAGLDIRLTMTPNRYMQDDAAALLDLLHKLNLPYLIGDVTLPARENTKREMDEFAIELDAFFYIKRTEREYLSSLQRHAYTPVPRYLPTGFKPQQGLPCGGGHSTFHVNWKGELTPCIPFASSVHFPITEYGFESAWNLVRQTMAAYKPPKQCDSCALRRICLSCPGEKNMCNLSGELNTNVCRRLKRCIDEGLTPSLDTIPDLK